MIGWGMFQLYMASKTTMYMYERRREDSCVGECVTEAESKEKYEMRIVEKLENAALRLAAGKLNLNSNIKSDDSTDNGYSQQRLNNLLSSTSLHYKSFSSVNLLSSTSLHYKSFSSVLDFSYNHSHLVL